MLTVVAKSCYLDNINLPLFIPIWYLLFIGLWPMNPRKASLTRILPYLFFKIAPVPRHGIRNFVAMSALMFCILCSQSFLRVLKDSVLISEVNVEIIAFIKLYFVLPIAWVFVVLYSKISNKLPYTKIYYYILSFFLLFFFIVCVFFISKRRVFSHKSIYYCPFYQQFSWDEVVWIIDR